MPVFIFLGTIRKRGVLFTIDADSLDEARDLAARGHFDSLDEFNAHLDDWEINSESMAEEKP